MTELIELTELEKLNEGDIVEFIHPETKKSEAGKYGVGKFVKTIQRRTGGKALDIELAVALGEKVIIQENHIRWDRTLHHKNKNEKVMVPQ